MPKTKRYANEHDHAKEMLVTLCGSYLGKGAGETQVQETEMSLQCRECAAFLGQGGTCFSRTEKWRSKWRSSSLVCTSHQWSAVSMPRGRINKAYHHEWVIEWVLLACALPSSLHGELFYWLSVFRQRTEKLNGRTGK